MNRVVISGSLGADPKIIVKEDSKIASYSVAISEPKGDKSDANWVNVAAFNKAAEFAQRNLKKGSKVIVEGKIKTSVYETEGIKMKGFSIIADRQELAGFTREVGKEKSDSADTGEEDIDPA